MCKPGAECNKVANEPDSDHRAAARQGVYNLRGPVLSIGDRINAIQSERMATLASDHFVELSLTRPELSYYQRARLAFRQITLELLSGSPGPDDLIALAAGAAAFADRLGASLVNTDPPERPIDCKAGCGHCCHISVSVTPVEVFRLSNHILSCFDTEGLTALMERLRVASAMTRDKRFAAYLPCPLLEDNICTAHAARPLNCRGLESMNAEACRLASHGETLEVPIYIERRKLFHHILGGLVSGTALSGRGNEQLDLTPALLACLEKSEAARRWLKQEEIFSGCAWKESD